MAYISVNDTARTVMARFKSGARQHVIEQIVASYRADDILAVRRWEQVARLVYLA